MILFYTPDCCFAQLSQRLSSEANGSRYRDSHPDIMRRKSKLEVSIRILLSGIREPRKREGRNTVGVGGDGGHQENIVH